jgi:hypothetical protein
MDIYSTREFEHEIETYFQPTFNEIQKGKPAIVNFNDGTVEYSNEKINEFLNKVDHSDYREYSSLYDMIWMWDIARALEQGETVVAYVAYLKNIRKFFVFWA